MVQGFGTSRALLRGFLEGMSRLRASNGSHSRASRWELSSMNLPGVTVRILDSRILTEDPKRWSKKEKEQADA